MKGSRPDRMPVYGAGIEKETEGVTLVSMRHSPRQFPLRPYNYSNLNHRSDRIPAYGTGFRGRDPGLYAP